MIENIITLVLIALWTTGAVIILLGKVHLDTKSLTDRLFISMLFLLLAVIVGIEEWI